jgi:glycosyltransferase involved in cell wall biosynthesis
MISFTIITSTLNAYSTLSRTINSVASQTYPSVQWIVVDGGSVDSSIQLLRECGSLISPLILGRDRGIYEAWNKALPHIRGDWVLFLGADDELASADVLEKVSEVLDRLPETVRLAHGMVVLVNRNGRRLEVLGSQWSERVRRRMMSEMAIPHQGVFHRREIFDEGFLFDEALKVAGDYDLVLREVLYSDPSWIDFLVARMGFGGKSTESANFIRSICERARVRNSLGLRAYTFSMILALCRAILRRCFAPLLGPRASSWLSDVIRRICGQPSIWTRL